ncbi:MAG: class I SAM-dependent methyltransferase [Caldilineaceae bacterium]
MQSVYQVAEIYHYGFGFRDTKLESAVLLAASDRFGNAGRRFLEIACGDCPYAIDLIQAGVDYHGLDRAHDMLAFSKARLEAAGLSAEGILHTADMKDFTLPHRFDLAFVLMGSLVYLSNKEFLQHLDRVYMHLNPGGLYIQEWCIEYAPSTQSQSRWTESSPLGEVGVYYSRQQRSALNQRFDEQFNLTLNGELVASTTEIVYVRYPNEFALLLQCRSAQWEMVGCYNHWDLDTPLDDREEINRPLCILKKAHRG